MAKLDLYATTGTSPPRDVQFSTLMLERMKVATRGFLSGQVLHDMKLETSRELEWHADKMAMQLSSYVLRERLVSTDQTADFSKTIKVRTHDWPLGVVPAILGAVLFASLGALFASIAVGVAAALCIIVAIIALAVNRPQTVDATVSGKVTIPVENFASFPENTTVYPESLGRVVRIQELGSPSFAYKALQ